MKKTTPLFLAVTLWLACLPNLAFAKLEEGSAAYANKDFAVALQELLPVAREGNASAQQMLGDMYLNGKGVALDAEEAVRWLRSAAEQNNAKAINELAHLYVQGIGVQQDLQVAESWYRKATTLSDANTASVRAAGKNLNIPSTDVSQIRCKQVLPEMPREAIKSNLVGVIKAGVFLVDGKPKDVIIFSGPRAFHESVRKAMLKYECQADLTSTVATQTFVFNSANKLDYYAVKEVSPVFAVHQPGFDSGWQALSAEQRKTVLAQHTTLGPNDEPPYPKAGMGDLTENIRLVAERMGVVGPLRLQVKIQGNGAIDSITFLDSPTPEFNKYVAAMVQHAVFKGALCAGQPCTADLPIHIAIERTDTMDRRTRTDDFKSRLIRADAGDAHAQNELGSDFECGCGVAKDLTQAVVWFRKASQQGLAIAQFNLGRMYESGLGIEKNWDEAASLYRKAAEQGLASAQNALGWMLANGHGVLQDLGESVKWFQKSADQGDQWGINNLGFAYETGRGVPQDSTKAFSLFIKTAEKNNSLGQLKVAEAYAKGSGVSPDIAQATSWNHRAAELGDSRGELAMGFALMHGRGVAQDAAEAVRWYQRSADHGNASGQNNLADAYENGRGVAIDLSQALKWYGLAAKQKNVTAIFSLSHMYRDGRGVPQDAKKSTDMLRQAAELGMPVAQFELGTAYAKGLGTEKDPELALQWYTKAAKSGYREAIHKPRETGVEN